MSETENPPSLEIDEGTLFSAQGPLQEIIAAFNGGKPIDLVNGVKTMLSDGFSVVGRATFLGTAQAQMSANVKKNGDITLTADVTGLYLGTLLSAAANMALPKGFNLLLPEARIVASRSGSSYTLNAAAIVKDVGTLVFTAGHSGQWQAALGFQLSVSNLAALPGLSGTKLAEIDGFVGLSDLMMVIASYDDADFDFPELSTFQVPALGSGKITLPGASGGKLVKGLNVYAGLDTAKSGGIQALAKFLKLQMNGSVGLTVAVSLPDPAVSTKAFLTVSEQIKPGVKLVGELGVEVQNDVCAGFLTATANAPIQGQPTEFDVTAVVLPTGALISGNMINTTPVRFTIDGVHFGLADLGVVIGIDDEGIPSLGFCATIDVDRFNAAVALFIDSTNPASSMFAAAVSDITLLDVVEVLTNAPPMAQPLKDVFDQFALKSLTSFSLPASYVGALNQRDLKTIAAGFAQHGVTIPSTSDHVLLDVNTPGQLWYLTDMATMNHYILRFANNAVAVSLEAQLYVAPQDTAIGALSFPKGYKIIGQIDLLFLHAAIDIEVTGPSGISADVYIDPITILNPNFLAITGAGGKGGPFVSLATYARPQEPDPMFRQPHFAMSGNLRLLGADFASVYMNFGKSGVTCEIKEYVSPLIYVDLNASFQSPQLFSFGGSIQIGVNNSINLGPLGTVAVNVTAHGSLNAGMRNGTAFATLQAGLTFQSWQLETPLLTLAVNQASLKNADQLILAELKSLLVDGLMKDVQRFLDWAKRGVLEGMQDVGKVAGILKSDFHLAERDIAKELQQAGHDVQVVAGAIASAFKLGAADVANVLHQAGTDVHLIAGAMNSVFHQTANEVASIFKNTLGLHQDVINAALKAANYAAKDIENAVNSAFDFVASKLNPSHW
jgi:hypothetical protein